MPSTVQVLVGIMTALAMSVTIQVGWTQIRERPVERGWLWLAAIAVGLVPMGVTLTQLLRLPLEATVVAMWSPTIAIWLVAQLMARRFPTGVTLADPDAPVFERINAAASALDSGDLDAATEALQTARDRSRPRLAGYVDLWLRLVAEERQRREGVRLSSGPTRDAIAMEMTRLRTERSRPATLVTILVLVAGVAVAVGVPAALGRTSTKAPAGLVRVASTSACEDAQPILAAAEAAPHATKLDDAALSHLTLVEPGEPAGTIVDTGLDLAAAAKSRHDPAARGKLEAAGFTSGYLRGWILMLDGHKASAEIFRFETASGAARFHRQATEYACRFANLAFAGPNGETGLQVRYSTDDRIVEQFGWVDGTMRIVVSRGFAEPPPNHDAIIDLARRATERLTMPQPAGSPIVP